MKNAFWILLAGFLFALACQKTEIDSPAPVLTGTWTMQQIEPAPKSLPEEWLGAGFTYDFYKEVFAQYQVVLGENGRMELKPLSPEAEPVDLDAIRYQVLPAQHILRCFTEGADEPGIFTYRFLEPNILEVFTDDGVRMVFKNLQ
ncbi:MAG: hypothetical protein KGS48_13760 [Bacteroidetes bacterium]|nr:hypothetical protein [Bacteroidota bacterium]